MGCRKSQPDHRHDYPRRTRHIVPEDRNTALRISKADQNRPVLERRAGALASSQLWLPWRGPTEMHGARFFGRGRSSGRSLSTPRSLAAQRAAAGRNFPARILVVS